MNKPLGKCDYCEKEAVVGINTARGCEDHLDEAMGGQLEPARALFEKMRGITAQPPTDWALRSDWFRGQMERVVSDGNIVAALEMHKIGHPDAVMIMTSLHGLGPEEDRRCDKCRRNVPKDQSLWLSQEGFHVHPPTFDEPPALLVTIGLCSACAVEEGAIPPEALV